MKNFKSLIRDIKAAAYILLCLFLGAGLGVRCLMHPLPTRSELADVEGTVAEIGTGTRTAYHDEVKFPVVRLNGHAQDFRYLDWFPGTERIEGLNPGDHVRLLSDTNHNHWIWELEKEGQVIISYNEIAAAVKANNRTDPYLAIFLLVLGTGSAVWYMRGFRRNR